MIFTRNASAALLALLALAGCTLSSLAGCTGGSKDPLIGIDVTGSVEVDGTAPAAYDIKLYAQADNKDAFDTSYCLDESIGECFGRVDVDNLTAPLNSEVTWDGNSFTIVDVPIDFYYVLVATGDDGSIVCTTDVVGFDEDTKVVTAESAIGFEFDESLGTFELPRKVRLHCDAPATEPEEPETPEEPEGEVPDDDIPEGDDPDAYWETFTITNKTGDEIYADASGASVDATGVDCGSNFPEVLQIHATAANAAEATQAYIRIQFGSGDEAEYRTIETPIVDGVIDQAISLTGGYSVVQLDLDPDLNGEGESYNVTFCTPDDRPAQEMLTILTWDKDDTDVDTHIYADGSEVAYYSLNQSWGSLDIDDIDGFGPETFTSDPAAEGLLYEVRVHYYSDHGNGDTTATMRVVYYDPDSQQICDVTASQSMSSYDWWTVGTFGPGMVCPE